MSRVLVVDNHDSFVHTIVQYLRELGATCDVRPRDDVRRGRRRRLRRRPDQPRPRHARGRGGERPPGPPRAARDRSPLLGVCLGHQAIACAYGATVGRAPELVHGDTSAISHDGTGVFAGLPSPVRMTRYHSLAVRPETVPESWT